MTTTTRPDAAGGHYEVQARRIVRRGRIVLSDDTRHATATALSEAQTAARALAVDGFTVWIYLVRNCGGIRLVYDTVETLPPTPGAPALPSGRGAARASGAA
jgi:hypothetical protein